MSTLHFEYDKMVDYTPIGASSARVTSITVHGVTNFAIDSEGASIETAAGSTRAPKDYTTFKVTPL